MTTLDTECKWKNIHSMDNVNVKMSARGGPWAVWLGGGGVVEVGPGQRGLRGWSGRCSPWAVWLGGGGVVDVGPGQCAW